MADTTNTIGDVLGKFGVDIASFLSGMKEAIGTTTLMAINRAQRWEPWGFNTSQKMLKSPPKERRRKNGVQR